MEAWAHELHRRTHPPALLARRDQTSPNVSLQAYGGAIAEVADSGSAFDHRATRFEYVTKGA